MLRPLCYAFNAHLDLYIVSSASVLWHVLKFNKLTVEDFMKEKPIVVSKKRQGEDQESAVEWKEFSDDVKALLDIKGLTLDLVKGIIKEAEVLLNTQGAIQRNMPLLGAE